MAHFDDVIWPQDVLLGSSGTHDDASVEIRTRAGFRQVIEYTTNALSVLRLDHIDSASDARALYDILMAVRRSHTFNVIDWNNHISTVDQSQGAIGTQTLSDQVLLNQTTGLAEGNASETDFDIYQSFTVGSLTRRRQIIEPLSSGFLVGVNGVAQSTPADYSIVEVNNRKIVRFTSAPGAALATTWGGRWYTRVYNASEDLAVETLLSWPNTQTSSLIFTEALFPTT